MQEIGEGATSHRELWFTRSLIVLLLSTLMALLFALGSLTSARAVCACQLRPAWLSFHEMQINWTALAPPSQTRQLKSRLWDMVFRVTNGSHLKENKYKQDTYLKICSSHFFCLLLCLQTFWPMAFSLFMSSVKDMHQIEPPGQIRVSPQDPLLSSN